ncbi:MAG: hypothetical protein H8E60_05830 [Candidatus Marinimicrobia bacterium]|nr:hypothetical protein [Candidatus Neomarinimicrobiota bacterium]
MRIVKNIIMLLMLVGVVLASQERVDALGGNAAFWSDDEANIGIFPQKINNFNLAVTDGSDFYVSWGDDMKFGFSGGSATDFLNLSWGMNNMGLNFGLNMIPAVEADTAGLGAEDAVNVINASFGMDMDFGDVGVHFNNEDGTNIGAAFRRSQDLWLFSNALVTFVMESPEVGDAVMSLGADLYTHLDIAENTTGLFALGFGYTNSGDGDITFPAMTFAVESAWTDWATVRAGFTKDWSLTNTVSDGVMPSFGLGFNKGSFVLDMNVGTDLFTNPVQKVTGFSSLGATSFNLTYKW